MRTTFEMDKPDYDTYRIRVLACNGYNIDLNGRMIHGCGWWQDKPMESTIILGENETKYLKPGKKVMAAYANTEYPNSWNPNDKCKERAQVDCFIEGLRKKDLGL